MVDQNNDRNMARFFLREEGAAFWRLDVEYRETSVRIVFPRWDHTASELQTIYEGLPKIVKVVLAETEVKDAMKELDGEIADLLGDGE